MNRIAIVLAVVAGLGGCKKKPSSDVAMALAKMTELADRMCGCKDKTCADAVQESLTKWSIDMAAKPTPRDEKPDDATIKKMTDVGQKYAECMTKAMQPAPTQAELPDPVIEKP